MATLPAFLRRTERQGEAETARPGLVRPERGPFDLRPLPHENLVFFCKRIDNTRLVRQADPKSRNACWSAIGGASVVLVLLTGLLAPRVADRLAGYKLENLRSENHQLTDQWRALELQEAELTTPDRLEKLAAGRNLAPPTRDQIVRLDEKADGRVAMVK